MGWLFQDNPVSDVRREMKDVFRTSSPGYSYEILDDAIASVFDGEQVYFAAVRHTSPDKAPFVFAAVILFRNNRKDGFGYKDMDETMGPFQVNCPLRILKLLSPTDHEYANKWREGVRAYHAERRTQEGKKRSLKVGDRIRFATPINYGGIPVSEFTVLDVRSRGKTLRVYRAEPKGFLCRIRPRTLMTAEVVT